MKSSKFLIISTTIFLAIAMTLLVPLFGQWYEQKTGIFPIAFYIVCGIISALCFIITIVKLVIEYLKDFKP